MRKPAYANFEGVVDTAWASGLAARGQDIARYNNSYSATVSDEVSLEKFGGLTLHFGDRVKAPRDIVDFRNRRLRVIDLAFDQPSLLTDLGAIYSGAAGADSPDEGLVAELRQRFKEDKHAGEIWAFPVNALHLSLTSRPWAGQSDPARLRVVE